MKKRVFSLIVAAVTAITLLASVPVFAAEPAVITTAEQLLAVEADGDYILGADVDLSGSTFDSSPVAAFSGTLDGNGYKITGLDITADSGTPQVGLIGMLTGTVKNLVVEGNITVTATYARAGGIAATSAGTVQNCRSNVTFNVGLTGDSETIDRAFIGGVVGYNREKLAFGTVKDCRFGGSITVSNAYDAYAGGITCAYGTVTGCVNEGDVTINGSTIRLAYAAGVAAYESTVNNSVNSGDISSVGAFQAYAGGISAFVGTGSKIIIQYCKNSGAVSASVTGEFSNIDVKETRAAAGGISAYTTNTSKVADPATSTSVVRHCANSGAVSSSSAEQYTDYAGGVAGVVNGYVYDCVETADGISGKADGAIFGGLNPSGVLRGTVDKCFAYVAAAHEPVANGLADGAITVLTREEAEAEAAKIEVKDGHVHYYHNVPVSPATCEQDETDTGLCAICEQTDGSLFTVDGTATGHVWDEGVVTTPSTCSATGVRTLTCLNDPSHVTTVEEPIDPNAHNWGEWTVTVQPTEESEGQRQRVCAYDETHVEMKVIPPLTHEHTLKFVAEKPATCTEAGNEAYYYCEGCEQYFADETATIEVNPEDLVIKATGHEWNDGAVTKPATCMEQGEITYTCKHNEEHTKTGVLPIDPDAHAWGAPTYVWAADNSFVTATGSCTRNAAHTFTAVASATYAVTREPTESAEGEGVYTAVFDGEYGTATQTKTVVIPKLTPVKPVIKFVDVPDGAFYAEAVDWAVAHDPVITNGTDETHFSPGATCTRGQVVAFLWRAARCPEPSKTNHPFTDVKTTAFYYKAMLWAVEKGITNGTSDTTFSPNATCTRGQVVAFLWRAKGSPAPRSTRHNFTDVKASGFYFNAMLWAVENGVTNGMTPTTFGPGMTCTRGQVVTFLYRAFK